jgi:hypothetical protein
VKATEFDNKFDAGEDVSADLDVSGARRPVQEAMRVNVDLPSRHGVSVALVDQALAAPGCAISVMGGHAGEGVDAIFKRKMDDVAAVGRTFWVARSPKARPGQVQKLCAAERGYVIFVEPATAGGARPTTVSDSASECSGDRVKWLPLPQGIGLVTGKLDDAATAFVFDQLTTNAGRVFDLWQYADASGKGSPVRFILGRSTVCAVRADMSANPRRMKSRYRAVVAVARLAEPYAVWLR